MSMKATTKRRTKHPQVATEVETTTTGIDPSPLTPLQTAVLLFVADQKSVLMADVPANLFGGNVASTREQSRDALAQLQRLRLIERRNDGTQSRYTASIAGAAIATQGRTP